ncbi:MAG: SDR family oxidoreductase [Azospirillum sp.]|nr:SDR family oxidoreductase [Azospirillum sp.]
MKNSTILVAGASRGLGQAIAAHLAPRCGTLFAASRGPARHGNWIQADLLTAAGLDAVVGRVGNVKLDALIVSAGTWEEGAFTRAYGFESGPETDIDRVLGLNLAMPIKLVRRLLPALRRATCPRILLIGALTARDHSASREVANSASKYGLRGAAHALRLEVPELAVTVLNPGNVATEEVEADIREGRFGPQTPIPMSDFLAVVDCALALSPASVVSQIDLEQTKTSIR